MSKKDEVYGYIVKYVLENMNAPTIREIMEATELKSTASVSDILKKLECEGKVSLQIDKSRGIKLIGYKVVKD